MSCRFFLVLFLFLALMALYRDRKIKGENWKPELKLLRFINKACPALYACKELLEFPQFKWKVGSWRIIYLTYLFPVCTHEFSGRTTYAFRFWNQFKIVLQTNFKSALYQRQSSLAILYIMHISRKRMNIVKLL